MTSSRSTVADVIEYDPENKTLALNIIEETLEIRQGVLPEVKRKMEVNFCFHCNVGEGHGLQSKKEIEKLLMRPSYCCLSIEEQETINLRNAYSYLMSHCDENQRLLEESMLREMLMEYSQGQTLHESRIVLQQSQNNSISRRIVSLPATR